MEAHARKAEADDAAARCAAHPLSPGDETACQAKLDAITAPAVPSPLLMIVGILLILGGGVCAALLHLAFLAFAVIGIGLTVTGLLRRKHAIAAQAKAAADRAALEAQIAEDVYKRQPPRLLLPYDHLKAIVKNNTQVRVRTCVLSKNVV